MFFKMIIDKKILFLEVLFFVLFIVPSIVAVPPQEPHDCPHILYKDFTGLHPYIVCCNSTSCLTFTDAMNCNGSGWQLRNCPSNHCYELKSEFKEIDIFDMLMNNFSFISIIIVGAIVFGFVLKWLLKKK